MKRNPIYHFCIILALIMFTISCKKDEDKYIPKIVTDIDGNVYHTITIGSQVWMIENLNTTRYRNGDSISNVTADSAWGDQKTGAYCNYDNDVTNSQTYGRLYNWNAVNDSRKVAPTGWHVPKNSEWNTLIDHLFGEMIAGGLLKETGTTHWCSPNLGATNESGFTALPGGYRTSYGLFQSKGYYGGWWSSTLTGEVFCTYFGVDYESSGVSYSTHWLSVGLSVRCVMD